MTMQVIRLPGQSLSTITQRQDAALWLPSSVFADREPPWVGRLPDGRLAALMTAGMDAEIASSGEPVQLELRRMGQTVWRAIVAPAAPNTEVILRRSGQEVQRERIP